MPDQRPGTDFIWKAGHRTALVGLLLLLVVVLSIRYARNPAFISNPQPEMPRRAAELSDRLDPNTAPWEDLAAIPNFGEKKAKALVAFREKWLRDHPNDLPFRGPQDLRNVKGIGPATVSNMTPFLTFPAVNGAKKK